MFPPPLQEDIDHVLNMLCVWANSIYRLLATLRMEMHRFDQFF